MRQTNPSMKVRPSGFARLPSARLLLHRGFASAFLAVLLAVVGGCGLTGGGIPPGEPAIPTGPVVIPGGRSVTGKVQSALPPYAPVSSAAVSIQASDGAIVSPSRPVNGDGSFAFANVPFGSLTLNVVTQDPTLQPLALPIQPLPQPLVQIVASPPPRSAAIPQSLTVDSDNYVPVLHQSAHVMAHLTGSGSAGLAPSWAAYGVAGYLTASGPVASFDPQAPGPEAIYAISGPASAAIQLTVPSGPGYQPPPATQSGGTSGGTTGGNQIVSIGRGRLRPAQ